MFIATPRQSGTASLNGAEPASVIYVRIGALLTVYRVTHWWSECPAECGFYTGGLFLKAGRKITFQEISCDIEGGCTKPLLNLKKKEV